MKQTLRLFQFTTALLFATALTLSSCSTASQQRITTFIESEYLPYGDDGTSTITGEAFLRMMDGSLRKCTGFPVLLNPATTYSAEWYERNVVGGIPLEPADPRALKFLRQTVGDSEGKFEFRNLPPGEYYAACVITVHIPIGYGSTMPRAYVARSNGKITLGPDQQLKAVLTNY
ncbi:MAG TPA: hypothetical protein VL329_08000 [Nitrospiraceae bacterium]|nr:hypothetical protein [Nitrospiraceae bacterium]